jgi:hypothetical protein
MSSGNANTTGPGRPEVATWKAWLMYSATRSARSICATHLAEHAAEIDFLEGFAFNHVVADLADEQNHRRRILERGVNADRGIGGARSARDKSDARLPGHFSVGVGHVGDAAFLAADDEFEFIAALMDGVEHRQIGFTGYAEAEVGAVRDQ